MAVPTLPDVKAQLNITNSTNDDELYVYLQAALKIIELRVGPSTVQTFTETVQTFGPNLTLSYRPLVSITSFTPLLDTWPTYVAADVNFDSRSGAVWRKDMGPLSGAYSIVYTAGWSTFPDNYNLATRLLVQYVWRSQRGGSARPNMGMNPEFATETARQSMPSAWQLPPVVEVLLADAPWSGGIA